VNHHFWTEAEIQGSFTAGRKSTKIPDLSNPYQPKAKAIMNSELFWYVGQLGLLLEIVGALYIALASISIHQKISNLFFDLWGFREVPKLVATMRNQARTDITGFLMLASGLVLQFIGNFG
jgi:hypothetical protein